MEDWHDERHHAGRVLHLHMDRTKTEAKSMPGAGGEGDLLLVEAKDFPIEAQMSLEDVQITKLDVRILQSVRFLTHGASGPQHEALLLGKAEELTVPAASVSITRGRNGVPTT